jgi:hypothetical protein
MSLQTNMVVFEIVTPGTWLDYADEEWSRNIKKQLDSLKSQFFEANTVLNLFLNAQSIHLSIPDENKWRRDSQRRSEIQRFIELEHGSTNSHDNWEEIRFETEVRFKREKWSNGEVPREFEHNLSFIYARAFLYALDAFEKFLGVLVKEANVPQKVEELYTQIAQEFPDLRGVRNTAQHLEDRARGLDAAKKPINLKPIINNLINAPDGGILALNNLNGSKYGSTMSNGQYGEVDVSIESMRRLKVILEGVLHSFKWRGSKQHAPNT